MNPFRALLCFLSLPTVATVAQSPPSPPVVSPEVHADGSVTFRLRAPGANGVLLALEGAPKAAMRKGADGVWTLTTAVLEPDFYGYSYEADGVSLLDPGNPLQKTNLLWFGNLVHVPGPAAVAWELNDVPHGVVHHHFYPSAVAGDDRDYFVYTPPGYDPARAERYPTLYLLHGFSDDACGWTAVGRANVILDNLIAAGRAEPMVVVMPLGYGTLEIIAAVRSGAPFQPRLGERNYALFQETLLRELLPRVERQYRVSGERGARAVAGLSMGGAEALFAGLNHPETFAWVGSFSAGGVEGDYAGKFARLESGSDGRLRLVWIACGAEDELMADNRKFHDWLSAKGVRHVWLETPGGHTWMVWRRNLAAFAPLLFRS